MVGIVHQTFAHYPFLVCFSNFPYELCIFSLHLLLAKIFWNFKVFTLEHAHLQFYHHRETIQTPVYIKLNLLKLLKLFKVFSFQLFKASKAFKNVLTFQKHSSCNFWQTKNNVSDKGKRAISLLCKGDELLSSISVSLLAEIFSESSNFDDSDSCHRVLPSRTIVKQDNIFATPRQLRRS